MHCIYQGASEKNIFFMHSVTMNIKIKNTYKTNLIFKGMQKVSNLH